MKWMDIICHNTSYDNNYKEDYQNRFRGIDLSILFWTFPTQLIDSPFQFKAIIFCRQNRKVFNRWRAVAISLFVSKM